MQNAITETVYDINGVLLACQRSESNNTKIIALHGWQDNSNSYLPLIKKLPHYDWYAIDFPGHGKSQWRHQQAHYYFVDYVDDIFRLKQLIAPDEKVIIMGHSMGAMVANLFAACFPEAVEAVIAIEGIGCVTTDENQVTNQLKNAILMRCKEQDKRIFTEPSQLVNARLAVSDLDRKTAELLMARNTTAVDSGYTLSTDPKLKHHSGFRFTQSQCVEVCKQIITPMLVLKATNGYELVKQGIENYGKYIKNLTIKEVPGGHHCHLEHPSEVAILIDVYVNEIT